MSGPTRRRRARGPRQYPDNASELEAIVTALLKFQPADVWVVATAVGLARQRVEQHLRDNPDTFQPLGDKWYLARQARFM